MSDVVISYARKDTRDFAGLLAAELARHTIGVWLDTSDIEGGAEWLQSIEQAISSCRVFIAVRSPGGRESTWVRRERLYALNLRKPPNSPLPIIPVIARDCPQDDLELIDRNPIDFRSNFEMALPVLIKEITRLKNGHVLETKDRRTLELAYLGRILLEYSIWQDLYTPMAGVAQMLSEPANPARPAIVTAATPIDSLFGAFWDEQEQAKSHLRKRTTEQRQYTDILPAIADMQQLVVLGDPGCGKTTTLWRIAADYATRAQHDPAAPLPIFVRLGTLWPEQTLDEHVRVQLGELAPHYEMLLAEKRLALLLDGLNELPAQNRTDKVHQIEVLVKRCQQDQLVAVVTCRELDFTGDLRLDIPQRVTIEPLDPIRIRAFVKNYIKQPPDAGDRLFWQLAGEHAQQYWHQFVIEADEEQVFWLENKIPEGKRWRGESWDSWLKQRRHPRSMLMLAQTPYMLYMMTQVFTREGHLPQNRGKLFQMFVDFLLVKREKLSHAEAATLQIRLANLAYNMQRKGEEGTSINRAELLLYLGDEQTLYRAQSANLLSGTDEIRFTHQLLQEFFAAHKLDAEMKAGTPAKHFWPSKKWWEPQHWEETAILLAGLYNDDCSLVLDWIAKANPEVAALCIVRSGAKTPDDTKERLRDTWLLRLIDLQHDPQPEARAAVGRALGLLEIHGSPADNRKGVSVTVLPFPSSPSTSRVSPHPHHETEGQDGTILIPDIDWVKIPAGEFTYGHSSCVANGYGNYRNNPPRSGTLPTFFISRYPITFSQFQAFIDSPDGVTYQENNAGIGEQMFKYTNHPRENINWYAASSFCRWLTQKYKEHSLWDKVEEGFAANDQHRQKLSSPEIRLPTEIEYERVARWTDGRLYPWGNDYISRNSNMGKGSLHRTSPVGIYPQGASVEGVFDLAGNVATWCKDIHYLYNDFEYEGTEILYVRGGSWSRSIDNVAHRQDARADQLDNSVGFWVVATEYNKTL